MTLPETPSQTIGPFFAVGLPWPDGPDVVADGTPGALWIGGQVTDGADEPVPDALVETWQADPAGRFAGGSGASGFRGFGRCATDAEGRWAVRTLKPGPLPAPDGGLEAPHLNVSVFARGLLNRLVTRIYFPDEPDANAADPLLASIPDPRVRVRLVATPDGDRLRFDIRLQGDRETPFLAL
ncbi:MAG TPA: protocatechuate 3,4-dioxygenase subunit alpha [Actinomycetota bacterium]|nr:protocatechuate 3,4-dioxygenase subunit alpha [Actinomycetota bacterium]